jgi:hypothetical protein
MQRRLVVLVLLNALAVRLGLGAAWWSQHLPAGARFGFRGSETCGQPPQTIVRGKSYQTHLPWRVFRTPRCRQRFRVPNPEAR